MIPLEIVLALLAVSNVVLAWAITRRPILFPDEAIVTLKAILEEIRESQERGKL